MKKLLFLFCLLSWSVLHAQKTINRPPFIAKATETIEIAAIHLSDTATVVDVDAKFIPKNWIRIAPATCLVADNGDIRSSHDSSADLLCIGRLQTEHCHQITEFEVDSCKSDYL